MRWISAVVAAATLAAVAWLGFAPPTVGLTNWVAPLECRAVLAPVDSGLLINPLSEQQRDATEEWLTAVGYIEDGEQVSAELAAASRANVVALCAEARGSRSTWVTLVAVFGSALTIGLAAASRRRPASSDDVRADQPERLTTS